MTEVIISPVNGKADLRAFIDLAWTVYADDPNWVPPLKDEVRALLTPGRNPWFEHGEAAYFLARQGQRVTGRISAHIDRLAQAQPAKKGFGPGTGSWGMLEALDQESVHALIAAAEQWLREKGVNRVVAPLSISIWDEPGLLIEGHDHPPTIMMGHNRPEYQGWIESAGYASVKQLWTYDVMIDQGFPPIIERIVLSGEKNSRIRVRTVNKRRFAEEAALILSILNDAWSDNWGFVPLTQSEIAFVGKKMKPLIVEGLVRVAEVEGEPVAFMIALPNLNEKLKGMNGSLLPFGWIKLLWWLRHPDTRMMRVPLMGVVRRLQSSRLASQLAFMMIEFIRREAVDEYGAERAEIGWVLDDNQGMNAIATTIDSRVNKVYQIYDKPIGAG